MIKNLLVSSGLSFILSFGVLIITSRLFEFNFIADIKAVTLLSGWLSTILTFQIHTAFLYFHDKGKYEKDDYIVFTFMFILVLAILSSISFFLLFDFFYFSLSISTYGKLFFGISCAFNMIFLISPTIFTAQNIIKNLPGFTICYMMSSVISIICSYVFQLSINTYSIIQCLLQFLVFAYSPWRHIYLDSLRKIYLFKFFRYKEVFEYSKTISLANILDSMSSKIDRFFAAKFYSQLLFAKYSILSFENPLVNVLLSSFGIKLLKTYNLGISVCLTEFEKEWLNTIKLITFITFPIGIFMIWKADYFVSYIFGERYLNGALIFQIYSFVCFFRYAPFQVILRIENLVKYNVLISFSFVVVAIIISLIVIYFDFGYEWLSLSYLVGWIVFNLYSIFIILRKTDLTLNNLVAKKVYFVRLFQCLFAMFLSMFLTEEKSVILQLVFFTFFYISIVTYFDRDFRKIIINYVVRKFNV